MAKVKELCGLIHSQYDTEAEFASKLGWDRRKLNRITNGQKEPDLEEVNEIAKGLNRPLEEIAHIFLDRKSPIG